MTTYAEKSNEKVYDWFVVRRSWLVVRSQLPHHEPRTTNYQLRTDFTPLLLSNPIIRLQQKFGRILEFQLFADASAE